MVVTCLSQSSFRFRKVHSLDGGAQVVYMKKKNPGVMVNKLVIHIDVKQDGCQDTPLR